MAVELWSIKLNLSISQNKAINSQLFSQYEGVKSNKPTDIFIQHLLDDVWSTAEYDEKGITIIFTDLDLFNEFVKIISDKVSVKLRKLLSKNPGDRIEKLGQWYQCS